MLFAIRKNYSRNKTSFFKIMMRSIKLQNGILRVNKVKFLISIVLLEKSSNRNLEKFSAVKKLDFITDIEVSHMTRQKAANKIRKVNPVCI